MEKQVIRTYQDAVTLTIGAIAIIPVGDRREEAKYLGTELLRDKKGIHEVPVFRLLNNNQIVRPEFWRQK